MPDRAPVEETPAAPTSVPGCDWCGRWSPKGEYTCKRVCSSDWCERAVSAKAAPAIVAAMLAVMPIAPTGDTVIGTQPFVSSPPSKHNWSLKWGQPEPLAAKYAATAYRQLASTLGEYDSLGPGDLTALADEIERGHVDAEGR